MDESQVASCTSTMPMWPGPSLTPVLRKMPLPGRMSLWMHDSRGGAAALAALDYEGAAVQLGYVAHEPEPHALARGPAREEAGELLLRHAAARVVHREDDAAAAPREAVLQPAALAEVQQTVGDEV